MNLASQRFCGECGCELHSETAPTDTTDGPLSGRSRPRLLAIFVSIALLAGGVAAWFLLAHGADHNLEDFCSQGDRYVRTLSNAGSDPTSLERIAQAMTADAGGMDSGAEYRSDAVLIARGASQMAVGLSMVQNAGSMGDVLGGIGLADPESNYFSMKWGDFRQAWCQVNQ